MSVRITKRERNYHNSCYFLNKLTFGKSQSSSNSCTLQNQMWFAFLCDSSRNLHFFVIVNSQNCCTQPYAFPTFVVNPGSCTTEKTGFIKNDKELKGTDLWHYITASTCVKMTVYLWSIKTWRPHTIVFYWYFFFFLHFETFSISI